MQNPRTVGFLKYCFSPALNFDRFVHDFRESLAPLGGKENKFTFLEFLFSAEASHFYNLFTHGLLGLRYTWVYS